MVQRHENQGNALTGLPELGPDMVGMVTDSEFFVAAFSALKMSILHFQLNTKKLTSDIKAHEPSPPLLVLSLKYTTITTVKT